VIESAFLAEQFLAEQFLTEPQQREQVGCASVMGQQRFGRIADRIHVMRRPSGWVDGRSENWSCWIML